MSLDGNKDIALDGNKDISLDGNKHMSLHPFCSSGARSIIQCLLKQLQDDMDVKSTCNPKGVQADRVGLYSDSSFAQMLETAETVPVPDTASQSNVDLDLTSFGAGPQMQLLLICLD